MLASVSRIPESGNRVHFGGDEKECFIENVKSGRKIPLRQEGNVYVIYAIVDVAGTNKRVKVVVDSGAAENVMPHSWFPDIATAPAKTGVQFVAADGNPLGNYGRKLITFQAEHQETSGFPRRA